MSEFWETFWWVLSGAPWYCWVLYVAALVILGLGIHSYWEDR